MHAIRPGVGQIDPAVGEQILSCAQLAIYSQLDGIGAAGVRALSGKIDRDTLACKTIARIVDRVAGYSRPS